MTDKDLVLKKYPDAKANLYAGTYYAIESGAILLGAGKVENMAWRNAREYIEAEKT